MSAGRPGNAAVFPIVGFSCCFADLLDFFCYDASFFSYRSRSSLGNRRVEQVEWSESLAGYCEITRVDESGD